MKKKLKGKKTATETQLITHLNYGVFSAECVCGGTWANEPLNTKASNSKWREDWCAIWQRAFGCAIWFRCSFQLFGGSVFSAADLSNQKMTNHDGNLYAPQQALYKCSLTREVTSVHGTKTETHCAERTSIQMTRWHVAGAIAEHISFISAVRYTHTHTHSFSLHIDLRSRRRVHDS